MKRLSFLVACTIFASTPCTFADTFDFSIGLRENVRTEISGSALVRSGSLSIAGICRKRIRFLKAMTKDEHVRTVAQAINTYMQSANLRGGDFEIVQLRRSRSFEELTHNADSLIRAYRALWSEVKSVGAVAEEGAEETAATTWDAKKGIKSPRKKWSGSRPDRQNGTQNGRSYRK